MGGGGGDAAGVLVIGDVISWWEPLSRQGCAGVTEGLAGGAVGGGGEHAAGPGPGGVPGYISFYKAKF